MMTHQQVFPNIKQAMKWNININLICITIKAIWNTYNQKMKLHQNQTPNLRQKIITYMKKQYVTEIVNEISQFFTHYHTLIQQANSRAKIKNQRRVPERDKSTWPICTNSRWHFHNVNHMLPILEETWLRTYIADVTAIDQNYSKLEVTLPIMHIPWPP